MTHYSSAARQLADVPAQPGRSASGQWSTTPHLTFPASAAAAALEASSAFRDVPCHVRAQLAVGARIRRYPAKSLISLAGDEASLIIVLHGSIDVQTKWSPPDLGPGDIYGAPAAIFTAASLGASGSLLTVCARTDAECISLPANCLLQLLHRSPELAIFIATVFGTMMERAMTAAVDNQLPTAERRCAATLYRLSTDGPDVNLTHSELGQMTQVGRSSVGTVLAALERYRILSTGYRHIEVCDRASLALIRDGLLSRVEP